VVDFTAIALEEAIVKVKGDGWREIVVFSDPGCPCCRQLDKKRALNKAVTSSTMPVSDPTALPTGVARRS
jgi:hypothetical protein